MMYKVVQSTYPGTQCFGIYEPLFYFQHSTVYSSPQFQIRIMLFTAFCFRRSTFGITGKVHL